MRSVHPGRREVSDVRENEMTDCANCGEPLVFRGAPPDLDPSLSYWTHRDKASNWCYDPTGYMNPDLPYEKTQQRAEPVKSSGGEVLRSSSFLGLTPGGTCEHGYTARHVRDDGINEKWCPGGDEK